jgi:hypothetical protein
VEGTDSAGRADAAGSEPDESDSEKDRTLAKATIQTVIKQLCKFFNHARKRKLVSDNPASGLSQLYSQASRKHEVKEPLTQQEVPLFLNAIRERKESRQVVPTKTKRIRRVDLSDELISVLKEQSANKENIGSQKRTNKLTQMERSRPRSNRNGCFRIEF